MLTTTLKSLRFHYRIIFFQFCFLVSISAYAKFESMVDESAMDPTMDPCEDFHRYACGKWIDAAVIPADKGMWTRSFSTIYEENLALSRKQLENFAAGRDLKVARNAKKLGIFYGACMNTAAIAKQTPEFLARELSRLDTVQLDTLSSLVGDLLSKGISVFLEYGSTQDFIDSSQMIAYVDQGGMGLPGRDYYFEPNKAEIRDKYVSHIARMLELSGVSHEEALLKAPAILKFETDLAEKSLRPVDRRDPRNLYHLKSLAELKKMTPSLNWDQISKATGSPKYSSLNVVVPDFITALNTLLAQTPLPIIRAYLRWRVISAFAMDLGGDFGHERFEFFQKTLLGQREMKPRWKYCIDSADDSLADALGEAFVAKNFSENSKNQALDILKSIQRVFEENLDDLDWMDKETRQYAVEKLHLFIKKIGYPDQWRNLAKLAITKDHLANTLACARFGQEWEIAKIGKSTDRTEWHTTPPTVNAYYNPLNNEIVFPAGILQSPMFHETAPIAANYGAFGAVIGHEMTHGFDDEGGKFDLLGNLKDWWSPAVVKIFDKKTECLVEQFSRYTVTDGIHIDGKLTLGENIADLGGVKLALAALASTWPTDQAEVNRREEEKKFFISYAQMWCSKATPEIQRLRAAQDPHAPEKWRVNGVLSNIPEFAKVFGCAAKKSMAPENRCSVW